MRSIVRRATSTRAGVALLVTGLTAPLVVLMVNAVVVGPAPQTIDFSYFGPAGAAMLTGRFAAVFADPAVQAGPFELAPSGVAELLGLAGRVPWVSYMAACVAAIVFIAVVALDPGPAARPVARIAAAAGAVIIGLQCAVDAVVVGHPADVVVPLLWLLTARVAANGRPELAAAIVALSVGFEVWGLLGAPLVLLAARPRLARSALTGLTVLVLLFGPFAATGVFRMFAFAWPVSASSIWFGVLPHTEGFPWPFRLVQAVFALTVGIACVIVGRRHRVAGLAAIVAISGARLSVDPVLAQYYWLVPAVAAVALAIEAVLRRDLALAAVAGLTDLIAMAAPVPPLRGVGLVLIGAGLVAAVRFAPRVRVLAPILHRPADAALVNR